MKPDLENLKTFVRNYIITQIFRNEKPSGMTDDTALISTRLIDSIATMQMVSHLEEEFKIEFDAYEVNIDNLDTVNRIANFLHSKIK